MIHSRKQFCATVQVTFVFRITTSLSSGLWNSGEHSGLLLIPRNLDAGPQKAEDKAQVGDSKPKRFLKRTPPPDCRAHSMSATSSKRTQNQHTKPTHPILMYSPAIAMSTSLVTYCFFFVLTRIAARPGGLYDNRAGVTLTCSECFLLMSLMNVLTACCRDGYVKGSVVVGKKRTIRRSASSFSAEYAST